MVPILLTVVDQLLFREHGHPGREREADPGPDLEPDRPLPARRVQLPAEEAHARMAQGRDRVASF